jgi:ankyrin repeat protein
MEIVNVLVNYIDKDELVQKCCGYKDHSKIVKFLLKKGVKTATIISTLNFACMYGNFKLVNVLLKGGAEPTSDALLYACQHNRFNIAKLLLKAGADPNANSEEYMKWAHWYDNLNMAKVLLEAGLEPTDEIIKYATRNIKDLLITYKYKVDGKIYNELKSQIM